MNQMLNWKSTFCVLVACTMLCSCADISITKRRYRSGFHVDIGSKVNEYSQSKKTDESKDDQLKSQEMVSRRPNLVVHQLVDQIESGQERKMSRIFLEEIQVPEEKPMRMAKAESLEHTIQEAKKKIPKGSISGWSLLAIIAFSISLLGFILMFMAIAFLIHGATIGGDEGWSFQGAGYPITIVTHLLGVVGFITGFISKKDLKRQGLRGKGFANLAWIFGGITLLISVIPALIYLVLVGGSR